MSDSKLKCRIVHVIGLMPLVASYCYDIREVKDMSCVQHGTTV